MVILIVDRPLARLTNAVSRHGFPRPKMAAALTYRSNGQQRQRQRLVYISMLIRQQDRSEEEHETGNTQNAITKSAKFPKTILKLNIKGLDFQISTIRWVL